MSARHASIASGAETHFAKKLASNEKNVRDKAVKKLKVWLSSRSVATGLPEADMLKLWKGLFYCMWMSDKPKIQEELAETVAQLLNNFACVDSAFEFVAGFFKTMYREWHGIDRLRLDKFYLLIRKFVYQSILFLKNRHWDEEIISKLNHILANGPLNSATYSVECANGVQVHVIQVYLEELSKIGYSELSSSALVKLLEPFSSLLATSKSHVITRCISQSIFNSLLEMKGNEQNDNCCKVNFQDVAEQLFTLASRKDIQGRNRNILYNYYNKFKKANCDQKGEYPGLDNVEKEEPSNDAPAINNPDACNGVEETAGQQECLMAEQTRNDCDIEDESSKNDKEQEKRKVRKRKSERISKAKTTNDNERKDSAVSKYNLRRASEKSKRSKSEDNENNNNEVESSKPTEKGGRKKQGKSSKKKNKATVKNNVVDVGDSTEKSKHEDVQQEMENLDGSYLGTISSCHGNGGNRLEPEQQSDTRNPSNAIIVSRDVEITPKSSAPTSTQSAVNVIISDKPGGSPPLAHFLRHSARKAKMNERKKSEEMAQESSKKQVRIELSKNTSQTTKDYHLTLRSSPVVPFDASKKPIQSSLRTPPSTNSSKKSKPRATAADFF